MNKNIILGAAVIMAASGAFAKRPLNHDAFDSWQSVKNNTISRNGEWTAFSTVPQEGDAVLTLYNTKTGKRIDIPRGYTPAFTASGDWALALVKPFYQATRKAKIDKKKDHEMPQDSLVMVNLRDGSITRVPDVLSYRIGKDGGEWVAWLSADTTLISPKALADKEAGRPMTVRNLRAGTNKVVKWVKDYAFSKDGKRLAFSTFDNGLDTLATDGMSVFSLPDTTFVTVDTGKVAYGRPVFNEEGSMLAFTATTDSAKTGTPRYDLFLSDLSKASAPTEKLTVATWQRPAQNLQMPHVSDPEEQARLAKKREEMIRAQHGDELVANQYSVPVFSHDGRRVVVDVAPYIAPDDTTIVDFERAKLDIWVWDAPYTPPQENINLDKWKKKGCPLVVDIASGRTTLISNDKKADVKVPDRWDGDWALLLDPEDNIIQRQWDYLAPTAAYAVNVADGKREKIGELPAGEGEVSPAGRYMVWYADKTWYAYDTTDGTTADISSAIPFPVWMEDDDHPMNPEQYGAAGWADNDEAFLIYDRHDIWSVDPKGKRQPVCLTAGKGRKDNLRYRYLNTDPEKRSLAQGDRMLLELFSYDTKKNGFATSKYSSRAAEPKTLVLDEYAFTQVREAKDAPVYTFAKGNFSECPQVYVAKGDDFKGMKRLSDANPQMAEYSWGDAQLVKWHAYNGDLTEGVLYTPENLDPDKKYPMLVVFYETNSEELYRHYTMEPSWSWVNYPFYVSRGYVVFVPDVHYTPGVPGESAYNYICSGVEDLCKKYPWIDKERIGIDGQSWGGYQTAFLVTRTNMFACAGSGAPVSNMTSAYGGIRWESGSSRQSQYEQGQSRIGKTLWEAPELYIANSPVFHADRVETPLLIMHNDADGAVPWYQGIELFMCLRRLQKPVWMLQYNGEAHNIRARKNRKDITIRLQQFFDHYLKDAPMPVWMKQGIRAERKGQEMGTELLEDIQ